MQQRSITPASAVLIFGAATVYFLLLLYTLYPYLQSSLAVHPAVHWFITGYFLFIPIFVFPIVMSKREGHYTPKDIFRSLNIRSFTGRDIAYAISGTLFIFILSGMIFGGSLWLHSGFGIRPMNTTAWFIEMSPFTGQEKLYLLVWLPMFFFNIIGEELLWRGYIQSRLNGRYAWLLCSALWMIFHIPFGIDLMILLFPIIIIIPYVFDKTKNTLVTIFIHAVYNGPIFIALALGLTEI
jgi:membrane protease YdiL (CAAX protease family)